MSQLTLEGKAAFDRVPIAKLRTMDKGIMQQVKIGEDSEEIKRKIAEEKEAAKRCALCKQEVKKYYDICNSEGNLDLCVDCIRKRHEAHGLKGNGFEVNGEDVTFYSQTTELETFKLKDITRVFKGVCFPNPVFPYCINLEVGEEKKNHCFGITKEFGEWLINLIGLDKEEENEEEDEDECQTTTSQKSCSQEM